MAYFSNFPGGKQTPKISLNILLAVQLSSTVSIIEKSEPFNSSVKGCLDSDPLSKSLNPPL